MDSNFLLFLAVLACCYQYFSSAFNLDLHPQHIKIVQGPAGSHFGFKIQSYRNTQNKSMLVVSAPKLNHRVEKGTLIRGHGGLLVCSEDESNCNRQFFFETKGRLLHKENKTNQNFGWSLQVADGYNSSSNQVPLIACAPMWRFRHGNVSEMTGACVLSHIDRAYDSILTEDDRYTNSFYPCLFHYSLGYHRQGYCQAGMSSILGQMENPVWEKRRPPVIALGAPGGIYWAGGSFAAPLGASLVNDDGDDIPKRFLRMSAGPIDQRHLNSSYEYDNGYFGYAMAFYSVDIPGTDRSVQGLAISGIKTKALGEVVLASLSLARNGASLNHFKNNSAVRGRQLSEAFGFSVACGDINGDGLPEVFVGAPYFFTNKTSDKDSELPDNAKTSYDSGRVYVFSTQLEESSSYIGPSHNLVFSPKQPVTLDGTESQARFGSAVEFLGDINDDGFGDFAVSAPFGGANRLGVVFIYLGSADGLGKNAEPSQIIEATDMLSSRPRQSPAMFGYTIQGYYDVDGNEYPDLLIGAIGADTVVVIRSRPIAKVAVTIQAERTVIDTTGLSNCEDDNKNTVYICNNLYYCFNYTGKSLPPKIDVEMTIDADVLLTKVPKTAVVGRAFFEGQQQRLSRRLQMRYGDKRCIEQPVQVLRSPSDLLTPIVFMLSLKTLPPDDPETLEPIFMTGEKFVVNTTVEIAKDCGDDNVCISDFQVDVASSSVRHFVLGDTRPFLLNATVRNVGEEAYGGVVTVVAPKGAFFNDRQFYEVLADGQFNKLDLSQLVCTVHKKEQVEKKTTKMTTTKEEGEAPPQTVSCELPQPFRTERIIVVQMSFSMAKIELSNMKSPEALFNLSVSSINLENNATLPDNQAHLRIRLRPDLTINLQVFPSSEQIIYEENKYLSQTHSPSGTIYETAIGPHIYFEILVGNNGPTTATRINVTVQWPLDNLRNQSLLYLVEPPYMTRGLGKCYAGPPINPQRLGLTPPNEQKYAPPSWWPSKIPSILANWNDADPLTLRCYVINVAAGNYSRIVLRTRLMAKNINRLLPADRLLAMTAHARVAKLPTTPAVTTDVTATADANVDIVTRMADFSLANVDLWIIAVALGAGLLAVFLVLLALWLAGCFDRKVRRPKPNYVKLATFEPIKTQAKRVPVVGE